MPSRVAPVSYAISQGARVSVASTTVATYAVHKNTAPTLAMPQSHPPALHRIPTYCFITNTYSNFLFLFYQYTASHPQIEANGQVEPDTILTTVANYQNNSGYSYYRLLGFKPVCRRYSGWKVGKLKAIWHGSRVTVHVHALAREDGWSAVIWVAMGVLMSA